MREFLTHFGSPRTQASRLGPCGNLTFFTETFNSFFAPITLQGFFFSDAHTSRLARECDFPPLLYCNVMLDSFENNVVCPI